MLCQHEDLYLCFLLRFVIVILCILQGIASVCRCLKRNFDPVFDLLLKFDQILKFSDMLLFDTTHTHEKDILFLLAVHKLKSSINLSLLFNYYNYYDNDQYVMTLQVS